MTTETISIEVDSETALAYREADQQRRAKLAILVRWGLDELKGTGGTALFDVMEDIGRKAQANGPDSTEVRPLLESRRQNTSAR